MPTTVVFTVNPAGGADYTSLKSAITTEAEDLTVSDQIHIFRYTGGATADTTAVVAADWASYVCDATRYIQIEVASGQEHGGVWNTNAPRLETTDATAIGLPTTAGQMYHIRVRGLQIRAIATTGSTDRRCFVGAVGITVNSILDVQNCILRCSKTGGTATNHTTVQLNDTQWATVYWGNNLMLLDGSSVGDGLQRNAGINMYVHNCGVVGANVAYEDTVNSSAGTLQVKNCWAKGCTTFSSGTGIENGDYNATDLSAATGDGGNERVSQTFTFVDEGNGDYRLASNDTAAKGFGVDLSGDANLPISTDMEGVTVNSPPDIGPLNAEEDEAEAIETRWRIYRAAA